MQAHESVHGGRPGSPRKQIKAAAPTRRRRPAVVLLEDDDDLRLVSAEVLRAAGFEVTECPTLVAAFVALRSGPVPDILLLDRELPDGSGLDLARWVRRRPSFDRVSVIGFSGRKTAGDVEAALAAGCDAFVGKPCAPATLVAKIEATSDARRRSGDRP